MSDPAYIHVVYIRAPIEKVWAAITDNTSERTWWWNTRHESDFKPGSKITYLRNGGHDVEGEILEADPPTRLVHTFHVGGPGPQHDEGPTTVEYTLEVIGEDVKLTVTHSGFVTDSKVRVGISNGWPGILSSLKSFLETGQPLSYTRPRPENAQ